MSDQLSLQYFCLGIFKNITRMKRENKALLRDQYEQLNNPNPSKPEEATGVQKFVSTIKRLFVRQEKFPATISRAVVAGTYFQLVQTMNIIVLYTVFTGTNSSLYSLLIAVFCVVLVLIDILPKISKKHLIFTFVCASEGLILIGVIICAKFLIQNYAIFLSHCEEFQDYFSRRNSQNYALIADTQASITTMCSLVLSKFYWQIGIEGVFIVSKFAHLLLYFKAYRMAKDRFEEEEKKKRRKDRYNQMMRKKYVYNDKKRV